MSQRDVRIFFNSDDQSAFPYTLSSFDDDDDDDPDVNAPKFADLLFLTKRQTLFKRLFCP
jgi:hypothetical protein